MRYMCVFALDGMDDQHAPELIAQTDDLTCMGQVDNRANIDDDDYDHRSIVNKVLFEPPIKLNLGLRKQCCFCSCLFVLQKLILMFLCKT